MNGMRIALFGVAALFLLAAAINVSSALKLPEQRKKLMRQGILYCLAGLVWVLVAFRFRL